MAITLDTFRLRFPEFESEVEYCDDRVEIFIDDAAQDIGLDENRWCGKYNRAHAYLSAHLLTVGTSQEAGDNSAKSGPVQSKSAGGVSVSRAIAVKNRSDTDEFYSTTSYGQQFILIRNSCFTGVLIG